MNLKDQLPQSTAFLVEYFEGLQFTKYWICTEKDLNAMWNRCNNEIILCCGAKATLLMIQLLYVQEQKGSTQNRGKRNKVEVLAKELKEQNCDKMELTEPQYRLWACMIVTGVHADKHVLPQILIVREVTPKRKTKDNNKSNLQDTIITTTAAVLKVING